jgi:hypothetical protein
MITWTDAAKVHERGGIAIAFAPPEIEAGKELKVVILDWRTRRFRCKVTGSNGAETQVLDENEDRAWSADSKGCYDAVHNRETMGLGMQNSRSSGEAIGVRMYIGDEHNQVLQWRSSYSNLADALTKDNAEARKKQRLGCLANPAKTQVDKENETEAEYEGDDVTFDVGGTVEM